MDSSIVGLIYFLFFYFILFFSIRELCMLRRDQDSSWKGIEEEDDEEMKQPLDVIAKWKRYSKRQIIYFILCIYM